MNTADLAKLSDEELVHKELELERELVTARFRLATRQLEDSSKLKKIRRDIARIQTVARAREIERGIRRNSLRDAHASSFAATASSGSNSAASGEFLKGIVDKIDSKE